MISLDPQAYIVRPGETMVSIAKKFGFLDWHQIYNSPCNAQFRASRPNPQLIRPKDRILIPPKPEVVRQVMQQRLAHLRKVRIETEALFQQVLSEMDRNLSQYQRTARQADVGAMIGSVVWGLSKIVAKCVSAMALSGTALKEANRELAKESVKFAYQPIKDPVLKAAAERMGAHEGVVWAVGKTTLESWINIQTPSWWASGFRAVRDGKSLSASVTSNPVDDLRQQLKTVEEQRRDTLAPLDQKIRETEAYVADLGRGSLISLHNPGLPTYT